jgi:hypothetical protein
MIRTSLVPVGVKQGNEKKPKMDKSQVDTDGSLAALDEYLREQTMTKKETELTGMPQQPPTFRDQNYNNTNSKLADYTSLTNQQFNLNSEVAMAMAANTIQNKRELYRIENLNNKNQQLASQFGLVESSKRQWKKGMKINRLSQQTTWM